MNPEKYKRFYLKICNLSTSSYQQKDENPLQK